MTNEQAIKVLTMVEAHGSLVIKAKEKAIKALQEQADGEYISRKSLLEDLYKRDYTKFTHRDFVALVQYQDIVSIPQTDGDLISKNGLRNAIGFLRKYNVQAHKTTMDAVLYDDVLLCINELPSVAIPSAYKGMTNGEVIKAVFPDIPRTLEWHIQNVTDDNWWNSPYKPQESEG